MQRQHTPAKPSQSQPVSAPQAPATKSAPQPLDPKLLKQVGGGRGIPGGGW